MAVVRQPARPAELETQMLAHELRSRISSIAARLDRVLLGADGSGTGPGSTGTGSTGSGTTLLDSARRDLDELAALGDRLVRRTSGRLELRVLEKVDLAELAEQVALRQEASGTRPGQRVRVIGDVGARVSGSRRDLEFVLASLVDNAVKYSPEGTDVAVRVRAHGELVMVRVTDHGIGLSTADRQRVWEPHFRAQEARDRGLPGSGVGLALTRRIVDDLHGDIAVRSEPGRGSTFTVLLPAALGEASGSA